jgi:hypothetical protein
VAGELCQARIIVNNPTITRKVFASCSIVPTSNQSASNSNTGIPFVMAKAVRICEAQFGGLFLYEGHDFRLVAVQIWPPRVAGFMQQESTEPRYFLQRGV